MIQNTSHAVMSQRLSTINDVDDFPTPPWATKALMYYVLKNENIKNQTCLEPACGRCYMSEVLKRYFKEVISTDKYDYGYAPQRDFMDASYDDEKFDWTITNPPFKLAEEFILKAIKISEVGVAIFARSVLVEGVKRYKNVFSKYPPSIIAPFVERVPLVKGRIDPKASTATSYSWFVWKKEESQITRVVWIPPCRKELEDESY
ncbi:MAG: SAM-dependent methyltransferase [Candidatus Liberibacter asiaticus]|nr:SAM-dependent methyltransferase [Candidatus Liberibacter asiaticus]